MIVKAKPVFYRPLPGIRDKLVELSEVTGIPINTIVNRAVERHLVEIEEWVELRPGAVGRQSGRRRAGIDGKTTMHATIPKEE